jgi:hypothetical protein
MHRRYLRAQLHSSALKALGRRRGGLRFSQLQRILENANQGISAKTVTNAILSLEAFHGDRVYRPIKGLYRLLKYRDLPLGIEIAPGKIREEQFYAPFAEWLRDELGEVTLAIALGGSVFKDRWGTPDVLGKAESRPSDVIKAPTRIVSAEIKAESTGLVTGFGQACAYLLFSHTSYLVIPKQTAPDELERAEALCRLFGLGLVVFDPSNVLAPGFKRLVRPMRHEPDLVYTNRYIKRVERQLF